VLIVSMISLRPLLTAGLHGFVKEQCMKGLETLKGWAREVIDLLLVVLVLGVMVQIIFGTDGSGMDWLPNITQNLTTWISDVGNAGFVGLIALLVILSLYKGRTA
jgi:hypothetical protein